MTVARPHPHNVTPESLLDERRRFYERRLPSGGYIAIETVTIRSLFGGFKTRGEIICERRPESRRAGHRAPIAACAENTRPDEVVRALLPYAQSDEALAAVLGRKVMVTVAPHRTIS